MKTNNKTSICLFATSDLVNDQRLQKVCASLSNADFEVSLFGRVLKNSRELDKNSFSQKRVSCIFNKGALFYLEFNTRIFFHLLFNKYNILNANDLDTVLGVWLASFLNKSKLVFDAHEYFTEVPELKGENFKKKIWKKIEKLTSKFDKHYTVNQSLKSIFKKNLDLEFEVIRNVPVLSKQKKIYKKKEEKYILYQGALNQGRGLEAMINAMSKIDVNLKIAGKGDIENDLKKLVREKKLENKVIFLGNLKPEELIKVTQRAFLGINLLENSSLNYYYSLANKFFDYMHQEIPQICMNFPEYKSINQENEVAVLIKNLDVISIINAYKKLQNESFYQDLQKNCKSLKQKYQWQNEEQVLVEIYQSLK